MGCLVPNGLIDDVSLENHGGCCLTRKGCEEGALRLDGNNGSLLVSNRGASRRDASLLTLGGVGEAWKDPLNSRNDLRERVAHGGNDGGG